MVGYLLDVYKHQKAHHVPDNIYKITQCDFAYSSNHIEGSQLTHEQTVLIFERNRISGLQVPIDDILEARNHFNAFDYMLEHVEAPLSHQLFQDIHRILKTGTSQEAQNDIYTIGEYKKIENVIGTGIETFAPEKVFDGIEALLEDYSSVGCTDIDDILDFHYRFERIHPFSDGNGRVGRLVMFKECLRHDITPFIITDDLRDFYIRGMQNWQVEHGWLRDTCLTAQDRFESKMMPMAKRYAETFHLGFSLNAEAHRCQAASETLEEGAKTRISPLKDDR